MIPSLSRRRSPAALLGVHAAPGEVAFKSLRHAVLRRRWPAVKSARRRGVVVPPWRQWETSSLLRPRRAGPDGAGLREDGEDHGFFDAVSGSRSGGGDRAAGRPAGVHERHARGLARARRWWRTASGRASGGLAGPSRRQRAAREMAETPTRWSPAVQRARVSPSTLCADGAGWSASRAGTGPGSAWRCARRGRSRSHAPTTWRCREVVPEWPLQIKDPPPCYGIDRDAGGRDTLLDRVRTWTGARARCEKGCAGKVRPGRGCSRVLKCMEPSADHRPMTSISSTRSSPDTPLYERAAAVLMGRRSWSSSTAVLAGAPSTGPRRRHAVPRPRAGAHVRAGAERCRGRVGHAWGGARCKRRPAATRA